MMWKKTDCCGCLIIRERGEQADIMCNECGAVVRTVPAEKAVSALAEMASSEICSAPCPNCGAHNIFLGFSVIEAFVCCECGDDVTVNPRVQ
jgi:hypothetical protein